MSDAEKMKALASKVRDLLEAERVAAIANGEPAESAFASAMAGAVGGLACFAIVEVGQAPKVHLLNAIMAAAQIVTRQFIEQACQAAGIDARVHDVSDRHGEETLQ